MQAEGQDRTDPGRAGGRTAVILGSDAVAAAAGSLEDLVDRCARAGFDIVAAPGCGDELVAGRLLEALADREARFVVACDCPRVRARLASGSFAAREHEVLDLVSPPAAAARYLRLRYGDPLHVIFAGVCPGAEDAAIDERLAPSVFLSLLADRDRVSARRPAVPPPDVVREGTARHASTPGGVPATPLLRRPPVDRVLRESDLAGISLAAPAPGSRLLIDLGVAAGCTCVVDGRAIEGREPPRRSAPTIVTPSALDLSLTVRATVAAAPPVTSVASRSRARDADRTALARLAVIPLLVVGLAVALGALAYVVSARAGSAPAPTRPTLAPTADPGVTDLSPAAERAPYEATTDSGRADSLRIAASRRDSVAGRVAPTEHDRPRPAAGARRRTRRGVEVVPGWLPQGRPAWSPGDSATRARGDTSAPRAPARPQAPPA